MLMSYLKSFVLYAAKRNNFKYLVMELFLRQ